MPESNLLPIPLTVNNLKGIAKRAAFFYIAPSALQKFASNTNVMLMNAHRTKTTDQPLHDTNI